jgi:hypothetical protein
MRLRLVGADVARDVVGERLGRLGRRVAVGDVALDLAVLRDGLAEARRSFGVADHDVHAALGDADAHRREREALDLEVAHHVRHAAADLAEEVGLGDAARSKMSSDMVEPRMPSLSMCCEVEKPGQLRSTTNAVMRPSTFAYTRKQCPSQPLVM